MRAESSATSCTRAQLPGHAANTPANHLAAIRQQLNQRLLVEAQPARRVEGGDRGCAWRGVQHGQLPNDAAGPELGACAFAGVDASATSGAAGQARSALALFNDCMARGNSDLLQDSRTVNQRSRPACWQSYVPL